MGQESEQERKRFLRKFAALSSAALLASAGAGGSLGCNEVVEYGPPPVETTTQTKPATTKTNQTTQTQPDEPVVVYGPPPVDNPGA